MSETYAPDLSTPAEPLTDEQLVRRWIRAAEYHRKPEEIKWLTSLAFVAGQQWVVTDRVTRTLKDISEVDPRYADVDLYVADIITEQRAAALGELQSDSDRPELLVPEGDDADPESESIADQVNRAVGHGWDFEWDGDAQLADVRRKCVDLGVAGIRCRVDPDAGGPMLDSTGQQVQAPVGEDGVPITDATRAHDYVAQRVMDGKPAATFKPVNNARIRWETGSAFNILVPPGVPHEKDFPWEIWVRPVALEDVKAEYPAAADLQADSNIGSVLGNTVAEGVQQPLGQWSVPARLADHVWLYTVYQRPTKKYPKGRVLIVAGAQKKLLRVIPELPYQLVDGTWHSGIVYFHWWRLTDRFYSRGLIDTLKDPQRATNRAATQTLELIDRSMPFGVIEEDALPEKPSGRPMEWAEVKKGTQIAPQWIEGPGPGDWMWKQREQLMTDAQHASTLSALKLGENPTNVLTYAQFAALQDQEASKRAIIRVDHQLQKSKLVELSLEDIKRFWPESKQLLVAGGNSNELQAHDFEKSRIPTMYVVRPAKGSAKPQSQAASLQLVADIWQGAVAAGAVAMNPIAWVQWLKASYEAGEPLELPQPPTDDQAMVAERENTAMLAGEQPAVAYWDNITVHLPIHRSAEEQARLAGDTGSLQRIEAHIAEHRQVAAQNAQTISSIQPNPQLEVAAGAPQVPGPAAAVPAPPAAPPGQ